MLIAAISLGVSSLAAMLGLTWRLASLVARFEATIKEHERMRSELPKIATKVTTLEARLGRWRDGGEF